MPDFIDPFAVPGTVVTLPDATDPTSAVSPEGQQPTLPAAPTPTNPIAQAVSIPQTEAELRQFVNPFPPAPPQSTMVRLREPDPSKMSLAEQASRKYDLGRLVAQRNRALAKQAFNPTDTWSKEESDAWQESFRATGVSGIPTEWDSIFGVWGTILRESMEQAGQATWRSSLATMAGIAGGVLGRGDPRAAVGAYKAAQIALSPLDTFMQEYGGSWDNMRRQGVSHDIARKNAALIGVINAAIEVPETMIFQQMLFPGTAGKAGKAVSAADRLAGSSVTQAITRAVVRNPKAADLVAKAFSRYLVGASAETAEEVAQEIVSMVFSERGARQETKRGGDLTPEYYQQDPRAKQLKEVIKKTLASSLGMMTAGQVASRFVDSGIATPTETQTAEDGGQTAQTAPGTAQPTSETPVLDRAEEDARRELQAQGPEEPVPTPGPAPQGGGPSPTTPTPTPAPATPMPSSDMPPDRGDTVTAPDGSQAIVTSVDKEAGVIVGADVQTGERVEIPMAPSQEQDQNQREELKPETAEKAREILQRPENWRDAVRQVSDERNVLVPVADILVNDRLKQYKSDADAKTGVVAGEGLGEFMQTFAKPVFLWQRNDGKLELATGRHRLDSARRTGTERIEAYIFREASGWTAEDMQVLDAFDNILEEKGTISDSAKFFKQARLSRTEADNLGLLKRERGRHAFSLAEGAGPDLWAAAISPRDKGKIRIGAAAAIAEILPVTKEGNEPLQRRAMAIAIESKADADAAKSIAERIRLMEAQKQSDSQQGFLFGEQDAQAEQALQEEWAKENEGASEIRNDLLRDRANLKSALTRGDALELTKAEAQRLGITNRKDTDQIKAAIEKLDLEIYKWDPERWITDQDLVNRARERGGLPPRLQKPKMQERATEKTPEAKPEPKAEEPPPKPPAPEQEQQPQEEPVRVSPKPASEQQAVTPPPDTKKRKLGAYIKYLGGTWVKDKDFETNGQYQATLDGMTIALSSQYNPEVSRWWYSDDGGETWNRAGEFPDEIVESVWGIPKEKQQPGLAETEEKEEPAPAREEAEEQVQTEEEQEPSPEALAQEDEYVEGIRNEEKERGERKDILRAAALSGMRRDDFDGDPMTMPIADLKQQVEAFGGGTTSVGDYSTSADVAPTAGQQQQGARVLPRVLRSAVDRASALWGNAPKVTLVSSEDRLPARIREMIEMDRAAGRLPGGWYGFTVDGEVYLNGQTLPDVPTTMRILFHEVVGHYGIEGLMASEPGKFAGMMRNAWNNKRLRTRAETLLADNRDLYRTRDKAMLEAIAQEAERGTDSSVIDRLVSWIRGKLRMVAPGIEFSDAEVRAMIAKAHDFVVGKGQGKLQAMSGQAQEPAYAMAGEKAATAGDTSRAISMEAEGRSREDISTGSYAIPATPAIRGTPVDVLDSEIKPQNAAWRATKSLLKMGANVGGRPAVVNAENRKRIGERNAQVALAERLSSKIRKGMTKLNRMGTGGIPSQTLNPYLFGTQDRQTIMDAIAPAGSAAEQVQQATAILDTIDDVRESVDELTSVSQDLLNAELMSARQRGDNRAAARATDLLLTLEENKGRYMLQSYLKFHVDKYRPPDAVYRAMFDATQEAIVERYMAASGTATKLIRRFANSPALTQGIMDYMRTAEDLVRSRSIANTSDRIAEEQRITAARQALASTWSPPVLRVADRLARIYGGLLSTYGTSPTMATGQMPTQAALTMAPGMPAKKGAVLQFSIDPETAKQVTHGTLEWLLKKDIHENQVWREAGNRQWYQMRKSFLKRKDLSDVYKAFIGEITDTATIVDLTMRRMIQQTVTWQFQQRLAELDSATPDGDRARMFYDQPRVHKDGTAYTEKLEGDGFGSLANKYTTKEIADLMRESTNPVLQNPVMRWLRGLMLAPRLTHTALNPPSTQRNFITNTFFALREGYPLSNPVEWSKGLAKALVVTTWRKDGPTDENFAERQRLMRNGLLGTGVRGADAQMRLNSIGERKLYTPEQAMSTIAKIMQPDKATVQTMVDLYKWQDDIFKATSFYTSVNLGMTDEQAADQVRKLYPDYSQAPELFTKHLTLLPFVNDFVTWPIETVRVSVNAMVHAGESMRNKNLPLRQRVAPMAGTIAALSIATPIGTTIGGSVASALATAFSGWGADDEDDEESRARRKRMKRFQPIELEKEVYAKELMPHYLKGGAYIFVHDTYDGKLYYGDYGYIMPDDLLWTVADAFTRGYTVGDTQGEKFQMAMAVMWKEIWERFVGLNMGSEMLFEMGLGIDKRTGKEIANLQKDGPGLSAAKYGLFALDRMVPPSARKLWRAGWQQFQHGGQPLVHNTGEIETPLSNLIQGVAPVRVREFNAYAMCLARAQELHRDLAKSRGTVTTKQKQEIGGQIYPSEARATEERESEFQMEEFTERTNRFVRAMSQFFPSIDLQADILKSAGWSSADIDTALNIGQIFPKTDYPDPRTVKSPLMYLPGYFGSNTSKATKESRPLWELPPADEEADDEGEE